MDPTFPHEQVISNSGEERLPLEGGNKKINQKNNVSYDIHNLCKIMFYCSLSKV